jgi:predicted alpha/beta hydrolase
MIIASPGGYSRQFYHPFAQHFQNLGYEVISIDYRGMGSSAPAQLKGFKASLHQWAVQDIDAVILFARNNFPNHEIIYVGHCIGGEIVGLVQASQYISRLVLVNSALSCKKLWPWRHRFRVETMRTVVGLLNKWFGYFPGKKFGLPADFPTGVMHEWANWCNNSNGLFDAYPDNNYRKLQTPLMAFSFSDDWHCPPKAVEELLNHFCAADITWHHFKPHELGVRKIGCQGFFNPEMKSTLWTILLEWLSTSDRRVNRLA